MFPYSRSLFLENDFGVLKTGKLLDFMPQPSTLNYSKNDPLKLFTFNSYERSFDDNPLSKSLKNKNKTKKKQSKIKNTSTKREKRDGKKVNKCVLKIDESNKKLKQKRFKKKIKGIKKYVVPVLLGLLIAKSVLFPVVLKGLAIMSAKGFLMGFFSTILASFLTLKGMFDHNHRWDQDRNDDKTQLEIIHLPEKSEHHFDDHYLKRTDFDFPPELDNNLAYHIQNQLKQLRQYPRNPPGKQLIKHRIHIKNPMGVKNLVTEKVENETMPKVQENKDKVSSKEKVV